VQRFDEILAEDFLCSNPDGSLVDKNQFLAQTARPVTISVSSIAEVAFARGAGIGQLGSRFAGPICNYTRRSATAQCDSLGRDPIFCKQVGSLALRQRRRIGDLGKKATGKRCESGVVANPQRIWYRDPPF